MTPLVSVIVPNYNYANYLPQRIDSILQQSYKNVELIILDDCSVDNSRDIIEEYRSESRVKCILFNEENSGSTFKQWKKGFERAVGEYIWIAECDDYSDKYFLEKIIEKMWADKDIKIGFSNSYWVTSDSKFINRDYTIRNAMKIYNGRYFVKRHLLKENYIYNASMAVFRRDALSSVDTEFEIYKSCGDKLFWTSMAVTGKVLFICEPLNYFRIHVDKVTSRSIINGTLFKEEYELFKKNIDKGYITLFNRWGIVRYFIKYVYRTKSSFLTSSIFEECMRLWSHEMDFRNKELPVLYRIECLVRKVKLR